MVAYLVRHGEAKSEAENPHRPLSERGREGVERVARAVAKKGLGVNQIFHSDKVRARETAEILAFHLSPKSGMCEIKGLAPLDDPLIAKAELETAQSSLMLVGHLPHLGRLASLLVTGKPDVKTVDFTAAAVVCLSKQNGGWIISWGLDPTSV
jgi:phosphohistidine phosphatase